MKQRLNKFARMPMLLGVACAALVATSVLPMAGNTAQAATPTVRFGVPEWPGVVVQSQIAADILEDMGYDTKQLSASPAFSLSSIKSGDLDVYLGGWIPTEKGMIDPLVKAKQAVVLTTNIKNALMGLAVPKYVWDAGVHKETDLAKFADKFDHKIYGIEPGSGFNQSILKAIKANRDDLGDWKLVESSTTAMLSVVKRAIKNKDWVVFLGWEPHSMNIMYDIKYLEAVGKPTIAGTHSDVLTVANPDFVKNQPQAAKFFKQYQVPKKVMSKWIYGIKVKDRDPEDIAKDWIGANLDQVAKWLDGVKTLDGKPAIDAVRAEYTEDD